MEGAWIYLFRGQGFRDRVILVVRECIWNALMVPFGLSSFDDTGSLDYPSRWVTYHLLPASRVPAGNRKAELKNTTFSSLLLFLSFLFS